MDEIDREIKRTTNIFWIYYVIFMFFLAICTLIGMSWVFYQLLKHAGIVG